MADRPGIIIYFDAEELLTAYSDEEVGIMLRAALKYGKTGETPSFSDRGMRTLWGYLKEKVDRDGVKYQEKSTIGKYAVFCREIKKKHGDGVKLPSLDEWKEMYCIE